MPELAELVPGEVAGFVVDDVALLACRAGEQLYAFLDRCPRCETSLAGATLARLVGGRAAGRRAALPDLPGSLRRPPRRGQPRG